MAYEAPVRIQSNPRIICVAFTVLLASFASAEAAGHTDLQEAAAVDFSLPASDMVAPADVQRRCSTNVTEASDPVEYAPSQVSGAVGETQFVVVANSSIGIYNKVNCTKVNRLRLVQFFTSVGATNEADLTSPQALYDPATKRFLVLALGSDNTGQYLFFAVSKAGGATGWKLYRLVLSLGNQKRFCQKTANGIFFGAIAGFSGKRWLVTLNETSNGITSTGAILSINKAPTLSGSATTVKCVNALLPDIAPPIVRDTSLRAFFLSTGAGPGSTIRRYKLQTGVTPANDVVVNDGPISVPAWASPPRARQPNGALLDTGNGGFFAASIQIGTTLWNVHTIKVGNYARWRLYKFSTAARVPSFTFTPTTTSGRDFLFNASLATTGTATSGRAFVTFSRTIPTNAVSGRLSMMIGAGPNALATGWKFNLIAISPEQVTGCKLAAGYCFFRGSTTQIDPGGGGAWGFSSLFKSQDQFDWITRAAKVN